MKRPGLGRLPLGPAFGLALGAQLAWLLFLFLSDILFIEYTAGLFVGTPAILLCFALLVRARQGTALGRARHEALALAAAGAIALLALALALVFHASGQSFRPNDDPEQASWGWDGFIALFPFTQLFSVLLFYAGARLFVRLYLAWGRLRQKRLIWDITHAQLRLLILVMLLVFAVAGAQQITFNVLPDSPPETLVYNILIALLALVGALGVFTAIVMLVFAVPASMVAYLTARRITRRLDALVAATEQLRRGQYAARIAAEGQDEIARLQHNFNAMAEQLSATRGALEAERDSVARLLESRRRLFADVSHELRTPIATVRSHLEALQAGQPPDGALVEREMLRLQRLIDDVFTLARADVEQLSFRTETVDLHALLERATAGARQHAWQSGRVDLALERGPEPLLVQADAERVEQIVYNLLRNAVRHTGPGGIVIARAAADGAMVRIEVEDTGEGIAAEHLPQIWERFYRSADTRAADPDGAGLGLALVKEMTEAMHGTVEVRSVVGQGSCFTVRLPRAERSVTV